MARPKIKLPDRWYERLLRAVSAAAVLVLIGLTVYAMIRLPARIPTHFGGDGRADGWGGKGALWLLPTLGLAFFIGLRILEQFPWAYNYPVEITEENAAHQYRLGRFLIEWLNLTLVGTFLYLQWQTYRVAMNQSAGLGMWFLPVSMLAVFGGLGFCIYRMVRGQ